MMRTNNLYSLLNSYIVSIPPIQRDYAQGRNTGKIPHIRDLFLNSIINVLTNDSAAPMELDFVYGYVEKDLSSNGVEHRFKPLDGQQRLTTLYLVYWFVAKKQEIPSADMNFLKRFSYQTRESSRNFCLELFQYQPSFNYDSISQELIDQPWFYDRWKSDPTIASMLVVLDSLEEKFYKANIDWKVANIWNKLTVESSHKILFHLLPMDDLGLPDDLYIKMNARGKGLTDFEYFKSEFAEILNKEQSKYFSNKVDNEWLSMFWNIFSNKQSVDIAKDVDNGFLAFFWYITDILYKKQRINFISNFWLDKVREVYTNSPENVNFLFSCLDLFERLENNNPNYFEELFYINAPDYNEKKTRLFFINPQCNLFRKCAETYGFGERKNTFSYGEQLLLYAFILMNIDGKIDNAKFRRLRNIFSSSETQLRSEYLSEFLYADIESIIESKGYSANSKLSKRQLDEELIKEKLIIQEPRIKELMYRLEDHHLLRGNIAIIPFDNYFIKNANLFLKLFSEDCNYFEISRAMLTIDDYSQNYNHQKRFGNKFASSWRELLTQSDSRSGFENTKLVLLKYLQLFEKNNDLTNSDIVRSYLEEFNSNPGKPKDWKYYYIKYQSFILWENRSTEGFYQWEDIENKPYECKMLFKQYGGRTWYPFLLEVFQSHADILKLDNYASDLIFNCNNVLLNIKNVNDGFLFLASEEHSNFFIHNLISGGLLDETSKLLISQENGVDLEDRIIKLKEFLRYIKSQVFAIMQTNETEIIA